MSKKSSKKNVKLLVPLEDSSTWRPKINGELEDLIGTLPLKDHEQRELRAKSVDILSSCLPPSAPEGSLTGLIIGRVQSGKTMSFTSVAALARDNMYQLIIVITGTTTSLSSQSVNRLRRDLRLGQRNGLKWFFDVNPKANKAAIIQTKLDLWKDQQTADHFKQTILIAVDKHHRHIANLSAMLAQLDLEGVSALVIDDEADQASLNAKVRRSEQSTTYLRILELRRLLRSHTYLQYTATPQAPLLINKIDVLSPKFVELLEPGEDYVGGEEFFEKGFKDYVIEIPPTELPDVWQDDSPPPSLEQALRMFLIGACDQICQKEPEKRSMMVHPSQETTPHGVYHAWVKHLMSNWHKILQKESSDKASLLKEFGQDYKDLKRTFPGIQDFDRLIQNLPQVLKITQLEAELNARTGKTPPVEWNNAPFHILVGGQSMDRGFTVEGLTVTYMPRPSGVGNADTIQQRARFFGYKKRYLGMCRAFLEGGVQQSFVHYVKHERDLRERLVEHKKTKRPLTEWKRQFFLHSSLKPTRTSVLDIDYGRGNFEDSWFTQDYPAAGGDELVEFNRNLVALLEKHLDFDDFGGHPKRTKEQIHKVCSVSLKELFDSFLINFKLGDAQDSQEFTGLLLQIQAKLDSNPDLAAHVVLVSPGVRARERDTGPNGKIKKLFQGANYDKRTGEEIYPGDREIRYRNDITVQIHTLDLKLGRTIIAGKVPTIAVWVPQGFANHWVVE